MPNSSGGFENADGSLLKKGERIWLENLDGYSDLCGLTITALGENGEIIWTKLYDYADFIKLRLVINLCCSRQRTIMYSV